MIAYDAALTAVQSTLTGNTATSTRFVDGDGNSTIFSGQRYDLTTPTYPYLVHWIVGADDQQLLNAANVQNWAIVHFQIDIFTDNRGSAALSVLVAAVRTVLDYASITFASDYAAIEMRPRRFHALHEDLIHHGILEYDFTVQELT